MKNGGKNSFLKISLREIVFGLNDSLVSTLGTVTGIAIGTNNRELVILSGLVLIFVEALSMSSGTYLSSKAAMQAEGKRVNKKYPPTAAAAVMGISYFLGGFVPLFPYWIFEPGDAILISILSTATILFAVGAWKARIVGGNIKRSGLEMLIISLLSAGVGFAVGRLASFYLGIEIY
jgi:VIT1/CCC1 family predicted Fe2+/Mn2+ transporter